MSVRQRTKRERRARTVAAILAARRAEDPETFNARLGCAYGAHDFEVDPDGLTMTCRGPCGGVYSKPGVDALSDRAAGVLADFLIDDAKLRGLLP
jgi:hypothetical protein